jgi:voltage-gated potassium channel
MSSKDRLARIRHRTWAILEGAEPGDEAAHTFHVLMMTLIILNVVAVILESISYLQARFAFAFLLFEVFSIAVFTVEYIVRIWSSVEDRRFSNPLAGRLRFAFRPLPLVDLLAILPFFLAFMTADLRILRALRLLRIIRIVKAVRYVAAFRMFAEVLKAKREELILTSGVMLVLLVIASSVMYFAEHAAQPEKFSSIPASMWWAIVTLTTVGYGDIYPITAAGQVAGAVVALLGIGFFALPTAMLGAGFVEAVHRMKAPRLCPHCGKPVE